MKKLPIVISIFFFISCVNTIAQVYPSISNTFRYGNGERVLGNSKTNFSYFENLTDARFQLPNYITIGVRFLYDDPPEVGTTFKGIQRRFIEYRHDNIYLRVGNFSKLYGNGLAFNLFEERGLGYDTWMDGLLAEYNSSLFNASLVGGTINFKDSVNINRNENYKIRGGNIELTPLPLTKIGFTYISTEGSFDLNPTNKEIKAEIPEVYANFTYGPISFSADWAHKWTNVLTDNTTSKGSGLYASLSYNIADLGITLDYKNYRFDDRDPFERNDFTRTTRMLPFQNPPIVMKEHAYTLLTRAIHSIDFNDEVGIQLDIFYSYDENTHINVNTSLSSRHDYYNYDQPTFSFSKEERSSNFLPSDNNRLSPYWEFYTEVEHYLADFSAIRGAFARRTKVIYNDFFGNTGTHIIQSTVIPIQLQYELTDYYSFTLEFEREWVNDNYNSKQEKYFNNLFILNNSFYQKLNVNLRYEYTNNNFEVSGDKNWFTVELGYRINQSHNVAVSYGRERGGQICSNGVCRYILPFNGFRLSLISNI